MQDVMQPLSALLRWLTGFNKSWCCSRFWTQATVVTLLSMKRDRVQFYKQLRCIGALENNEHLLIALMLWQHCACCRANIGHLCLFYNVH